MLVRYRLIIIELLALASFTWKIFDNVCWDFLFSLMWGWRFPLKFCTWTHALLSLVLVALMASRQVDQVQELRQRCWIKRLDSVFERNPKKSLGPVRSLTIMKPRKKKFFFWSADQAGLQTRLWPKLPTQAHMHTGLRPGPGRRACAGAGIGPGGRADGLGPSPPDLFSLYGGFAGILTWERCIEKRCTRMIERSDGCMLIAHGSNSWEHPPAWFAWSGLI